MTERLKILIVDDKWNNLVALRQVLSGIDAEIVEATTGNQALAATLDHDFAMVILDVQMPGMSGYELAEYLRGDDKTRMIPIMFLTASSADEQHVFKGYEVGAIDYLTKPYSAEVLRGKVNVFLQMAGYRREVEMHRDHLEALVMERTANLNVRIKEIRCLYAVSSLVAEPGEAIDDVLQAVADVIAPGWPYPEIAGVTIVFEGRRFTAQGCTDTPWKVSADIVAQGMPLGSVEVCHLEERPASDEGQFPREEQDFINTLARHLGLMVERKRAEALLRQSETRLSEAQRLAHVGSWELHPIDNTLTWSDEIYRILELDPATCGPSYEARAEAIHPEDRALLEHAYAAALETRTPYAIDYRVLMKDGRVKHVHEHCEDPSRPEGRPLRLAGTVQDITERRLAEWALLAANAELTRLDAMTTAFVATVSHELRTPLAITKEAVSLVLDEITGPTTAQQQDVLGAAARNLDRLARLINDLLDTAKLQAGMMPRRCALVDIVALARQVVSDYTPQAARKSIALRPPASTERIAMNVDPDKVVEIFGNLIANAIAFTATGHIEVHVTESADTVECVVADTGPGIRDSDLPHVFDKFQQFGRVCGPGSQGTGLGLAIVKGLVELHHGTLRVESRVGEGTAFTFVLPKYSRDQIIIEQIADALAVAKHDRTALMALLVRLEATSDPTPDIDEALDRIHDMLSERFSASTVLGHGGILIRGGANESILLAATNGDPDGRTRSRRLMRVIREYIRESDETVSVGLSCGSCTYPDDAADARDVLLKARAALASEVERRLERHILIVQDDRAAADELRGRLAQCGYLNVAVARDGEEARADMAMTFPALIALDMAVPRTSAQELIETLMSGAATRAIPIVLISGSEEECDGVNDVILTRPMPFLRRPFSTERIEVMLESLL